MARTRPSTTTTSSSNTPEANTVQIHNKEAVIDIVKRDGCALETTSEVFKGNKDVVMAAVKQNCRALKYASKELLNDKKVILAAVTQEGYALKYSSEALRNDKEVVLAAVTQDGNNVFKDSLALRWASEALQNDKEVVLAAVTQNGHALRFASEELQNDKEVVQVATMQLLIEIYNMCHNHKYDTLMKVDFEEAGLLICKLLSKKILVPLDVVHVMSACGLYWNHGMGNLIEQDHLVLESKDEATGLLPFMTFASRNQSRNYTDLNTLFQIIQKNPQTVRLNNTNR